LDRDILLVKTWIDALKQIGFVTTNHEEIVITPDGINILRKLDSE
jgi:ribosomal protein S19E (S16A)